MNLFEVSNYPTEEPVKVVEGTLWAWRKPELSENYPATDFTLKYRFRLLAEPFTDHELTAGVVDGSFVVEQADTSAFAPGEYVWRSIMVRNSDGAEVALEEGHIEVRASLAGGGEARSYNYRVLMAIRATIEGTASQEQQRIVVTGREIWRRTIEELLMLEKEFSKRWNREKREMDKAAGRNVSRKVLVGLGG